MATPTSGNHGRTLVILTALVAALVVWTFWPGLEHAPKLGLDLRGGTQVILTPKAIEGTTATFTEDQLNQTVSIIRARVDGFGVAEAEVTSQGSGNNAAIVVSVPGNLTRDQQNAIASTAKLDFRPVLQAAAGGTTPVPTPSPTGSVKPSPTSKSSAKPASPSPTASGNNAVVPKATGPVQPPVQSATNDATLQKAFDGIDCSAKGALVGGVPVDPKKFVATCQRDGAAKYLLEPATVLGTQITAANATPPTQGLGGWVVTLSLDSEGAAAFLKTTTDISAKASPQNQFGIVLDGLVVTAPSVRGPIPGGQAEITGNFTQEEARALANVLKYGALPVTLQVASVDQISASLGSDQLTAGLIAGGLGLLLVVLYLLAYYRALGVVAVLSLVVAGLITYCLFVVLGRQLGLSLSLAGVAGAIVAIGITADSFVVYFERIRDEVRDGKSLRAACDSGWIRARRTLLAADFVSFLAAALLYLLSVGNVRGFAFTLGLTTIVDVLVAFMFTRPIVALLARSKFFARGGRWTGISTDRIGTAASPPPSKDPVPTAPATAGAR